jgi:transposase-like protein
VKYQRHTEDFKDAIVTKILNRGNQSVASICENEGIPKGTAMNWVKARAMVLSMKKNKSSKNWTAEGKLKAVTDTLTMSEEDLGAYLRANGLHSHQLKEWKTEMLKGLSTLKKPATIKDNRDKKIQQLEKDIKRKDRALAEASALLILQKKVNLIWGNSDEDES